LPEEPFVYLDSRPAQGMETPDLLSEIAADRSALEGRNGFSTGPFGSAQTGIRLLGESLRKSGGNWPPSPIAIGLIT
jgi:hypothetical protein